MYHRIGTPDEDDPWGLAVSPDLDSVLYTLADLADEERGWGRADETWNALAAASAFGGEDWFRLGDRDLGLHLVRTHALRLGAPLSAVTARIAAAAGVEASLLPATDDRLRTWLDTPNGSFPFQEWFVARGHRDPVDRVRFDGAAEARPAPGVLEALHEADAMILGPGSFYTSVLAALVVPGVAEAVMRSRAIRIFVCNAMTEPGETDGYGVAEHLQAFAAHGLSQGALDYVFDEEDAGDAAAVSEQGVRPVVARTLMSDPDARRRLAEAALDAVAFA